MKERSLQPESIKRVVVRGANWVGDAVMTVPALRELRRVLPGAHITLATRAWAEGIFDGAEFLDDLLLVDRSARGVRALIRQAREWRARRFDLALLLPNAFEPALVAAAARVPFRVGYATDGRRAMLTHPLTIPDWRGRRHEVFYYLNLVAELERLLTGASDVEAREPRIELIVSETRRREARELLRGSGARPDRPLVALCPGSTNSRAKRWPAASYAALADLLIDEMGADVLLVGAGEEREVSDEVAARMRRRPIVLTGQTELAQMVAVLCVADLLVTNDTGPAHIVAALGRPVVVIFGPTNPHTTRPFSTLAEVVREPPVCAPCMLRDCPIDHRCMTAISPAEVFARALKAMATNRAVEVAR
ncbi:MAG: lipopolysaccharide heptosyltransferase II [Acidobacteria bacterium]|nr:lipopolysaccharide heptosyltransferase II [Acidobacteriota bacterium]